MDQYHIRFYLVGGRGAFAPVEALAPLEGFRHTFTESAGPEEALAAEAGVILADLRGGDAVGILRALEHCRRAGSDLIVLAAAEQAGTLAEDFPALTDIWTGALGEAELTFRFRKWQRDYALRMDLARRKREAGSARYLTQLPELFSDFLSSNMDDIYMVVDGTVERVEFITPNIERVLGLSPEKTENLLGQLGKVQYLTGSRVTLAELEQMEPGTYLETRDTERVHHRTGEHHWFRESVHCVSVQDERKYIVCIADRTSERKAQDALQEALKMAQVANRAKSSFLSSVSHDIRTPMNAIIGFLTLMENEVDNPETVLEYTHRINAASQQVLAGNTPVTVQ